MDHFYQTFVGEDWFDFQNLYKEAVARTPDLGTMVELGVWKGRSFAFLVVESINSRKRHKVIGIDQFIGDGPDTAQFLHPEDDIFKIANENLSSVKGRFQLIRADSAEAAKEFIDGSVDFVFVDAAHDYVSVRKDITAWLPKMKSTGMIAGHDYKWSKDVMGAVDEIFGKKVLLQEASWKVYMDQIERFSCGK